MSIEHQMRGEVLVCDPKAAFKATQAWGCNRCRNISPTATRTSCMDGLTRGCPMVVDGEPLAKVLPAGGPLLGQAWHCGGCRTTFKDGKPAACPVDYPLHMCEADGGRQ